MEQEQVRLPDQPTEVCLYRTVLDHPVNKVHGMTREPACFQGRQIYDHDFRRCARPSAEELAVVARIMAERLNRAIGPVKVLLPLRGWSEADREGGPLYDPQADKAFGEEMKKRLKPQIEVLEVDTHLNDPLYAQTAVALLEKMISGH